jgi:hypothetical protein
MSQKPPKPYGGFWDAWNADGKKLEAKYGNDFAVQATSFGLNKAEKAVIDAWNKSLLPEILAIQKAGSLGTALDGTIQPDEPYYGATGGGLTYSFIPTGLGTIIVVKESITGKELNVSDALDWFFYG